MRLILSGLLVLLPSLALAQSCPVSQENLRSAKDQWQANYLVLSDIGCGDEDPTLPAHVLLCESAWADGDLWNMAQLDDAAYTYAYENATGQEVNLDNPPRDSAFIATRDACRDTACLCAAYIAHTNDSLGGLSPY